MRKKPETSKPSRKSDPNRRGSAGRRSARPDPRSDRRLWLPVIASAAVALVVRWIYLVEASDNPFWRELGLDLQIYDQWARALSEGRMTAGPFTQAPLFPYLLSYTYGLLGADPVQALWMHLLPGTVAVAAIAWAAGRWRGPEAAWCAGMLAALSAPAIFYTGVLLPPTWILCLSSLLLALGLELRQRRHPGPALGATTGLLAGLLCLGQPLALALVLPLAWFTLRSGARRVTVALAVGLLLPIAVTWIHNGVHGAWTPIAVNGGINLYIGNGPDANGAYVPPAGMEENRDLLGIETARAEIARSTSKTPAEVAGPGSGNPDEITRSGSRNPTVITAADANRYWMRRALESMASNPVRAAGLWSRKLLLFFGQYEIPQIESFPYEKRYSRLLQVPLPGMALVAALALLGLLLGWADRTTRWLALSLALFAGVSALFFVTARFRMPVLPWMMTLAAAGLTELFRRLRTKQIDPRMVGAVATSVGLLVLLSINVLGIDSHAAGGQYAFRQGVLAEKAGRTADAIAHYREAVERDPRLAKANVNLGTLLARAGQTDEALPFLEAGAGLDAGSGTALQNLGQLYQVLGRDEDALVRYQRAVEIEPDLVSARESLAYLLYATGQIKETRKHLQTILLQSSKGSPPNLRAGTLLAITDERTDLVRQFASGAEPGIDPTWWAHPALLRGDLALTQRRVDEARAFYREAAADPAVAPYALDVLRQMDESLGSGDAP